MNILIVEDHPMTALMYKDLIVEESAVATANNITIVQTCQEAYNMINICTQPGTGYDLAILDHNIPPCPEKKLNSGGDIALLIKKMFPSCKVFIITSHTEVLIIYDLIKKVKPEGLAIKNDITACNFPDIIRDIIAGKIYKSMLVKQCLNTIWKKGIMIEDYNRQILMYLAKGYRLKDIEQIIPLSPSAIRNRITKMKKVFNSNDNSSLIRQVIEEHYL